MGTADPATDSARRPRGGPPRRRHGPAHLPGPAACTAATPTDLVEDLAARGVAFPVQDGDLEHHLDAVRRARRELLLRPGLLRRRRGRQHRTTPPASRSSAPILPARAASPRWAGRSCPEGFTQLLVRLAATTPACRSSSPRTAPPSTTSPTTTGFVARRRPHRVPGRAHRGGRRGPRAGRRRPRLLRLVADGQLRVGRTGTTSASASSASTTTPRCARSSRAGCGSATPSAGSAASKAG